MNKLLEAAGEVCAFMAERKWKFCIIGGLAVQQWGEPRTTLHADFTLLTGWGDEERFVGEILEQFESRFEGAREHALSRRVLLVRASNSVSIDIALGALPFEEAMIERAAPVDFSAKFRLPCCTAEDLFIMKVFAGRPRDWQDAVSVADRRKNLDSEYILGHLKLLCDLRDDLEPFERARNAGECKVKRPTIEEQRQLVRLWDTTGRELDQMRRDELRDKPYDWEEVDALLSLGESYDGPPRLTSGLEEQQRLFMKLAPDWYKKLRGIE